MRPNQARIFGQVEDAPVEPRIASQEGAVAGFEELTSKSLP
jgi:hypothetical protein